MSALELHIHKLTHREKNICFSYPDVGPHSTHEREFKDSQENQLITRDCFLVILLS